MEGVWRKARVKMMKGGGGVRDGSQSPNKAGRREAEVETLRRPMAGAKAEVLKSPMAMVKAEALVGWDPLEAGGKGVGWDPLEAGGKGVGWDPLEAGGEGVGWNYLEPGPLAGKHSRVLARPPMEVCRELVAWEPMKGLWQQTTSAGPPTEEQAQHSAGPPTEEQG